MKAIIVDDETANIENLERLLEKFCPQVNISGKADSVSKAVELIESTQPELIFLDIQMGSATGFDLLSQLPDRNFEVIFVTAYDQYGIQAVKVAALDYILKPIDSKELVAAVSKAEEKIKNKNSQSQLDFLMEMVNNKGLHTPKIALPQAKEIRYLLIEDIIYCKAENTYTVFYLQQDEKVMVSKPLKNYAEILSPYHFLRPHQSYLINPNFVKSWLREDGGSLLLKTGIKIPVSKPNREFIKQALGKR